MGNLGLGTTIVDYTSEKALNTFYLLAILEHIGLPELGSELQMGEDVGGVAAGQYFVVI